MVRPRSSSFAATCLLADHREQPLHRPEHADGHGLPPAGQWHAQLQVFEPGPGRGERPPMAAIRPGGRSRPTSSTTGSMTAASTGRGRSSSPACPRACRRRRRPRALGRGGAGDGLQSSIAAVVELSLGNPIPTRSTTMRRGCSRTRRSSPGSRRWRTPATSSARGSRCTATMIRCSRSPPTPTSMPSWSPGRRRPRGTAIPSSPGGITSTGDSTTITASMTMATRSPGRCCPACAPPSTPSPTSAACNQRQGAINRGYAQISVSSRSIRSLGSTPFLTAKSASAQRTSAVRQKARGRRRARL